MKPYPLEGETPANEWWLDRKIGVRKPFPAIVNAACYVMNAEQGDIGAKCRHPRVVRARELIVYLARRHTVLSFPEISKAMGRPNHSTVITAVQRFERNMSVGGRREQLNEVRKLLGIEVQEGIDNGTKEQLSQGQGRREGMAGRTAGDGLHSPEGPAVQRVEGLAGRGV